MIGKVILTLVAILLGIITLAAGLALITTVVMMLYFGKAWKAFLKEFKKKWKEHEGEWND